MAFQPVTDAAEITIIYTQNLETVVNVFHAHHPGGYIQAQIENLAAVVDLAVDNDLIPVMTEDCVYLRTEVRGLTTENDMFAVDNTNTQAGAVLTPGMSNSVTLSLKKGSGKTGRSARGRWYFVGIPAAALTSNENFFETADVAGFVDAVDDLRESVDIGDWDPVIVSRFTGGAPRATGKIFAWLTVTAVNEAVDTQRRRLSN